MQGASKTKQAVAYRCMAPHSQVKKPGHINSFLCIRVCGPTDRPTDRPRNMVLRKKIEHVYSGSSEHSFEILVKFSCKEMVYFVLGVPERYLMKTCMRNAKR